MSKYRLEEMSWMEAEEAMRDAALVLLPVGTLHGHGPTPIGVDSFSVDKIADLVAEKTGVPKLPLLVYGENEKQKFYPGSITINPATLEEVYVDILKSIKRNGVRKVIILNGHGGNREIIIRACLRARKFNLVAALLEWYGIGNQLVPDLYEEAGGGFMMELALAVAIYGEEIADIRLGEGYKGEWGKRYTMKKIFGEEIAPLGFHSFEYKGAKIIIPVDAWDLDVEGPPVLIADDLPPLVEIGEKVIHEVVDFMVNFVETFSKVDLKDSLKTKDTL
jgi:creatinine amidohydrolase/Fe(II)-dependent formamide hydrolase-like protein